MNRPNQWPAFLFDVSDGDPRFVEEVRKAVDVFRFEELPEGQQDAFRQMKRNGSSWVLQHIRAAMAMIQPDLENPATYLAELYWAVDTPSIIFRKIPASVRQELFPYNEARFHYIGTDIVIEFRSLERVETGRESLWHSRLKPTVRVRDWDYVVAFTQHLIEAIQKRIVTPSASRIDYATLGDVFSYLAENVRFDLCYLLNERNGEKQLALTFYEICFDPRCWAWRYVENVLGVENRKPELGIPYYRMGYCPAFLDEEHGLIKLGTLLLPGYKKTPEYKLLADSPLPEAERLRLQKLAMPDDAVNAMQESDDFSAIKWFHDNGIPQVIQTKDTVYQVLPKRDLRPSFAIKK